MKIKYVIYARKSSESSDRQIQSIGDQIDRLTELATQRDFEIVKIFKESKSAKAPDKRPVFSEMMKYIEEGKADGVLCWQLNRLSRNPIDSAQLQWMLQTTVIKAIQTYDRVYLPEDNAILFSVETGTANQYIIDLRKNTLRGLKSKAAKGWYPGQAPIGYLNDVYNKTIIKDPERFDLVRQMWDLLLEGVHTAPKVREIINEKGLRTIQQNNRGGKPLALSSVYRIFHDPFYTGYFRYPKFTGELRKGLHPPMITQDEFDRAQEILGGKDKPRNTQHKFAYTGIMKCGFCGASITAEEKDRIIKETGKRKKFTYYRCTRRKKGVTCNEKPITLNDLEGQILTQVSQYTIPETFKNWAIKKLRKTHEEEVSLRTKDRTRINKDYERIQQQLDNLVTLRIKDLVTDDEFKQRRDLLLIDQKRIKDLLENNESRAKNWLEAVEKSFNFITYAEERFINGGLDAKREILMGIGTTFVLEAGKIKITPPKWLIPISNHQKKLKIDARRLELAEKRQDKRKNEGSCLVPPYWGRLVEDIRTEMVYNV